MNCALRGISLFLLLFTYVCSQVTEIQRDTRIFAFNVNSNLSYAGHEFRNHQLSNFSTKFLATQCAMECHRTARCQSFNFASKTRQCQLNDATHDEFPNDLANDSSTAGIMYYLKDAITISSDAVGPCGNHPCKNSGRCLDTISSVTGNRTFFCLCQDGWRGDVCDIKEDSLGWAPWAEWSQCSTSCGNGYHVRQRKCKNLDTGEDLSPSQCYGRETEYKACQFRKCPMWDDWAAWGECSTLNTCGRGSRSRTRTCGNGGKPGVDRYCLGPVNETMACDGIPCNGMVRLRNGVKFGEGRVEMFHSFFKKWLQTCADNWNQLAADTACKQRGFLGAHAALTNGTYDKADDLDVVTLKCSGNESFLHQCRRVRADQCSVIAGVQCMVRGAWSLWSSWGDCSVTCENGTRTRTRVCNHPPPNFGGRDCPGDNIEYKPCTKKMCPVNGVWEKWSTWSDCSVSCANGTKYRTRSCIGPYYDGKNCTGDAIDTTSCFSKECPVDGIWKEWAQWTKCTVTCGYGTRNRSRSCEGPFYDGKECKGPKDELESCNTFSCPVDGSWKTWSEWDTCSVTCGGGIQNRTRECNMPLHGGTGCTGHSEESRSCNEDPCPVDGVWTAWTDWSICSVTCANGTQWRNRTCVGPLYGGMNCTGEEMEEKICVTASCPVNGVWKAWSEWDQCNVTCGGGEKARRRECDGPYFKGDPCKGPKEERQSCNTFNCPIDGIWEAWSNWTECTRSCGGGESTRTRNCVGPFYNGTDCQGDWNQTKTCNTHSCAVPGDWMTWSGWSLCSTTCGTGVRWRTRECNTTSYGNLTAPCEGTNNGTEDCNTFPCRPFAATCSQLRDWGMVDSSRVQLKPERKDKWSLKPELEPVWIHCDMESEGGVGVTVIRHDREERTRVFGYEGAGSYVAIVNYNISTDHVIAIIDASKNCKQYLKWECKGAVIHNPHQMDSWTTFWTNRSSEFNNYVTPASYFAGGRPGSGNCACGETGSCANASLPCNCDSNDFQWRSDEGYITYKDDLPILAFRAGDTGSESEDGYVTVGPVLSYGTLD